MTSETVSGFCKKFSSQLPTYNTLKAMIRGGIRHAFHRECKTCSEVLKAVSPTLGRMLLTKEPTLRPPGLSPKDLWWIFQKEDYIQVAFAIGNFFSELKKKVLIIATSPKTHRHKSRDCPNIRNRPYMRHGFASAH